MLSSRSFTVPVLTASLLGAGLLFIGGCDRESPDAAQPASNIAATNSPTGGKEAGAKGEGFNGTLDISHRGAQMPDITFTDPAGQTLRLTDLRGKPLLVNLWATWCGPCVLEMPTLDALAAAHEGRMKVLTVSQDMEGAAKVGPFFAGKAYKHLEPWMDTANDLGFHYNTGMLPTTVLYDAKGREVWRMIGAHDWSGSRTQAMLADTLGDTGGGAKAGPK